MPGMHTYIYTDSLTYKFTLHPWPRIMDSAGKRKRSQMDPTHGPPLQAHVAAANRTVLQLANMLVLKSQMTILAHMEGTVAKQTK